MRNSNRRGNEAALVNERWEQVLGNFKVCIKKKFRRDIIKRVINIMLQKKPNRSMEGYLGENSAIKKQRTESPEMEYEVNPNAKMDLGEEELVDQVVMESIRQEAEKETERKGLVIGSSEWKQRVKHKMDEMVALNALAEERERQEHEKLAG